ncbi:MAG TPA: DUF488 family protein [Chloroflexota bacterium]|nr:DUF488 family protein [Chloroflexota bacterium]
MPVRIRRVYDPPAPDEGYRVLIDRLWPRGLRKDQLPLDAWLRELAVSDGLRRWFGHEPARWEEFRQRYRAELLAPERRPLLEELARRARDGTVTILYGARDPQHNNAVVLAELLEELSQASGR